MGIKHDAYLLVPDGMYKRQACRMKRLATSTDTTTVVSRMHDGTDIPPSTLVVVSSTTNERKRKNTATVDTTL